MYEGRRRTTPTSDATSTVIERNIGICRGLRRELWGRSLDTVRLFLRRRLGSQARDSIVRRNGGENASIHGGYISARMCGVHVELVRLQRAAICCNILQYLPELQYVTLDESRLTRITRVEKPLTEKSTPSRMHLGCINRLGCRGL